MIMQPIVDQFAASNLLKIHKIKYYTQNSYFITPQRLLSMKCNICLSETKQIFTSKILNKHTVKYFHCAHCGFLQTEEPFWLDEAYSNPINNSDTGYLHRNLFLSQKLTILLSLFFNIKEKYLDYAGGYGVFVRLMRDIGFDYYWDDKFTTNLFARGFEFNNNFKIEAITTFESFEHFDKPNEEIEKLLQFSRNIIFSIELLPQPIPKPEEWWYYGQEHGQHISFYSEKTFKFISDKYKLNYYNLGCLHILTEKKLSNLKLFYFNFNKYGFHKLLRKKVTSKTWDDHFKIKNTEV